MDLKMVFLKKIPVYKNACVGPSCFGEFLIYDKHTLQNPFLSVARHGNLPSFNRALLAPFQLAFRFPEPITYVSCISSYCALPILIRILVPQRHVVMDVCRQNFYWKYIVDLSLSQVQGLIWIKTLGALTMTFRNSLPAQFPNKMYSYM